MCILLLAIGRHPRYPLIVVANRDERRARPSAAMHRWRTPPIVAGRDGVGGGTWFGVNAFGQLAAVANYHRAHVGAPRRSRGQLPLAFLATRQSAAQYENFLRAHRNQFNPFNLIYGDVHGMHFASNVGARMRRLQNGFYGVGNGDFAAPSVRVSRGAALLAQVCARRDECISDALLEMMRFDAAMFIRGEKYGTRATTLLFADNAQLQLHECSYAADGAMHARRRFVLPMRARRQARINTTPTYTTRVV